MKIRNTLWFGLIAVAIAAWSAGYAQTSTPSANQKSEITIPPKAAEVVKLAQSGVGEDVILAYVKNCQATFNLSANDILALKDAGISPKVLTAMLNHDGPVQSQPESFSYDQKLYAPSPAQASPQPAPSIAAAPATPPPPPASPPPAVTPAPQVQSPAPTTVVVQQAPPAPQVEVIPVAPGPEYEWAPGYWSWRGGTYIWIGGCWMHRPRPGVVWVGGHWSRHPHGYVWVSGRWR